MSSEAYFGDSSVESRVAGASLERMPFVPRNGPTTPPIERKIRQIQAEASWSFPSGQTAPRSKLETALEAAKAETRNQQAVAAWVSALFTKALAECGVVHEERLPKTASLVDALGSARLSRLEQEKLDFAKENVQRAHNTEQTRGAAQSLSDALGPPHRLSKLERAKLQAASDDGAPRRVPPRKQAAAGESLAQALDGHVHRSRMELAKLQAARDAAAAALLPVRQAAQHEGSTRGAAAATSLGEALGRVHYSRLEREQMAARELAAASDPEPAQSAPGEAAQEKVVHEWVGAIVRRCAESSKASLAVKGQRSGQTEDACKSGLAVHRPMTAAEKHAASWGASTVASVWDECKKGSSLLAREQADWKAQEKRHARQ